jgi:hypothetical protein
MKRSLAALAVALAALVTLASCNETNNTFQPNTGALLSFLSPANATAGGSDFTLTLNGLGFVDKTVVQWNGQSRPTKFVDSSKVTATITAADIAKSGRVFINTLNPTTKSTDNGLSNTLAFIVDPSPNPVPAITSISPTSAVACGASCASASFTLTVTGSNFLAPAGGAGGSVVQWNSAQQTNLTPTSVTGTQIQVTIPGALIGTAGTATVTVFNPTPGGGTSPNGQKFTITPGPVAGHGGAAAEDAPAISSDGRYVAYTGGDGGHTQVFLRDSCEGADAGCQPRTILVSSAEDGSAGNGDSRSASISAEGRFVAFSSAATNLLKDSPSGHQVFLRDTCLGAGESCKPMTQLISTDLKGALTGTENLLPTISASGRFVAFLSVTPSHADGPAAAKGTAQPNSGFRQVFVRDTCLGAANCTPRTTRISLQPGDAPADGTPQKPALSGQAGRVALAGRDAMLFTRGTAIDDRVFLAVTKDPRD